MKSIGLTPKILNIGLAASLAFNSGGCDLPIIADSLDSEPKTSERQPDESNGWQRIKSESIQKDNGLPIAADIVYQDEIIGEIAVGDTLILDDQTLKKKFPGKTRDELHDLKMFLDDFDGYEIHLIGLKNDVKNHLDDISLGYWSGLTDPYFVESFKKALQTDLLFPDKKVFITILFTSQTAAIANPSALNVDEESVNFIVNFNVPALKADFIIGNADITTHEALHTHFLPNHKKIPSTLNESLANFAGRMVKSQFERLGLMDTYPAGRSNSMFMSIAEVRRENGLYLPNSDDPCNEAIETGVPQEYCNASTYELNLTTFEDQSLQGDFPFAAHIYIGKKMAMDADWDLEGKIFTEGNSKRFLSDYELMSLYLYLSLLNEDEKSNLLLLSNEEAFNTLVETASKITDPSNELFRFNVQAHEQLFIKHIYQMAGMIPADAKLAIDQIVTLIRNYYPDGSRDSYAWYVKSAAENNFLNNQIPSIFPKYESTFTTDENKGVYRTKIARPLLMNLTSENGGFDINYTLLSADKIIEKQRATAKKVLTNFGYEAERLNLLLKLVDEAKAPFMSYTWQDQNGIQHIVPSNEDINLNEIFKNAESLNQLSIVFEVHAGKTLYPIDNKWNDFLDPWNVANFSPFEIGINIKDSAGNVVTSNDGAFKSALANNQSLLNDNYNLLQNQLSIAARNAEAITGTVMIDTISFDFSEDSLNKDNTSKAYLPLVIK
jgi:hypothetical protein